MKGRHRIRVLVPAMALAGLAPLAAAQDTAVEPGTAAVQEVGGSADAALCGGLGRLGEWAGGDASSSDLSSVSAALDADGRVPGAGQLVRMFFLGARTDVRLEVAGRPSGDPFVTILDADGTEVAADDDGGGNLAARVETALSPGAYCLVARSYDDEPIDVAVRLGRDEHEPLSGGGGGGEACEAEALATLSENPLDTAMLEAGVRVSATTARTPAWGFTLAEPTGLTITARSGSGDPLIRLRDASGALLAENDDADGTDSRIDRPAALAAGDYCLQVDDLGGGDNAIDVRLALFDPAAERRRRIDAGDFSPLPDDEVTVRALGSVDTSLIADVTASEAAAWVQFDVPEDGLILIEAIGQGVDPAVVLFDRVGRRLAENDDGPDGLDSLLVRRVRAGSYTMAVTLTNAGDAVGNVRVLLERFVPAK